MERINATADMHSRLQLLCLAQTKRMMTANKNAGHNWIVHIIGRTFHYYFSLECVLRFNSIIIVMIILRLPLLTFQIVGE